MAIHSLASGSDPKVVCGLLAREALKALQGQPQQPNQAPQHVFFTNLIRLLEIYRYDLFTDLRPKGVLVRQRSERSATQSVTAENMNAVRSALQAAHRQVFGQQSTEQVVEFLQGVLSAMKDGQHRSAEDLASVRSFIEAFSAHLKND